MTKLRAAVSDDGAAWRPVDGGRTFATGAQPMEEGAVWIIEFDNAVSARYVRLSVDGPPISLRCGLLGRSGGGQAEGATVMPDPTPFRRAVVDCGTLPATVTATHIPGGVHAATSTSFAANPRAFPSCTSPPHTLCDVLYLVPMLIGCWLVLGIRCCDRFGTSGTPVRMGSDIRIRGLAGLCKAGPVGPRRAGRCCWSTLTTRRMTFL